MEKTDSNPVKRLYKYYDILAEAGDAISQHESVFNHIMEARLGNPEEKRLAAQFIPKFCKDFPHLAKASVSAQLDLCEDSNIVVRKQAIKEIAALCRSNPLCTKAAAYFISQLLEAKDVGEGLLVRITLVSLFNVEPSATISGIFAQIRDGSPKARERCLTFLFHRLGGLNKSVLSQMRDALLHELEICLENSNSEEIPAIVPLVTFAADENGLDKCLVQLLEKQLSLEKGKMTSDEEDMKRIYEFTKLAKPHFAKGVDSGEFVNFYCAEILPLMKELKGFESGSDQAAAMLKQLSEISQFCSELPDALDCYKQIFTALQDLLPMEPDPAGSEEEKKHPRIHFTLIECLLTSLLELVHRVKSVNSSDYEQALEELRTGLKTLIRYVEPYRKHLVDVDKSTIDNQVKSVSLRCFANLKILSRHFLATPVKFSVILPSWSHAEVVSTSAKKPRKTSVSTDHHKKDIKARGVQQIYTPPGGKYSRSFKRF